MNRALFASIALTLGIAASADVVAAATATGEASVTIERPVGIQVISPLVLPTVTSVTTTPVSTTSTGGASQNNPTGSTAADTASNAALTIYGQAGEAVSMAVPQAFTVVRTGGTETLTVRTTTNAEYDLAGNGVVIGGSLNADTMSVNVGGAVTLASNEQATPGPYEGLLVVVVQYN